MNISFNKIKKALEEGLDINGLVLLLAANSGIDLTGIMEYSKVQGWWLLLEKKGFIQKIANKFSLTSKGNDFLNELVDENDVKTTTTFNFDSWAIDTFKSLQAKLEELTNSKQVRRKINDRGRAYSFLPGERDFCIRIADFVRKYKCDDFAKIHTCLIKYIEKCHEDDHWFPIITYYIMRKDKGSDLMTDIENYDEKDQVKYDYSINA